MDPNPRNALDLDKPHAPEEHRLDVVPWNVQDRLVAQEHLGHPSSSRSKKYPAQGMQSKAFNTCNCILVLSLITLSFRDSL